jgi:hypothetical protein
MGITRKAACLTLNLLMCSAMWIAAGCMQPDAAPVATSSWMKPAAPPSDDGAPTASNIVKVNKFFNSDPWLNFEADGTNKIDGVRFSVYLESAEKPTGVFGTGRMVVIMYRLGQDAAGREMATPIHEWDLPPDKAYPWRAKQKTALGWGYGLRLHWDPKLDVAGSQIAFVVKYVREDGRTISSSRQVLKVPAPQIPGTILATPASSTQPPARSSAPRVRTAAASPGVKNAIQASP